MQINLIFLKNNNMLDKKTKNLEINGEVLQLGYYSLKLQKWISRLWNRPSVYTALLTQSSTTAPTATVLVDNITGITFNRTEAGTFTVVSNGAFIEGKTVPNKDSYTDIDGNYITVEWTDVNTLTLKTYAAADTSVLADGVLTNQFFNIEVYNN